MTFYDSFFVSVSHSAFSLCTLFKNNNDVNYNNDNNGHISIEIFYPVKSEWTWNEYR